MYFIPLLSENSDASFPIDNFSCQAAVAKVMSTCPGLKFLDIWQHANLSWAKFSSSLVVIKICHNQWKLVSANQRRSFIGVYNKLFLTTNAKEKHPYLLPYMVGTRIVIYYDTIDAFFWGYWDEAEVNITFEGWLILMLNENECTNCFVICHCLSFPYLYKVFSYL